MRAQAGDQQGKKNIATHDLLPVVIKPTPWRRSEPRAGLGKVLQLFRRAWPAKPRIAMGKPAETRDHRLVPPSIVEKARVAMTLFGGQLFAQRFEQRHAM